MSIFRRLVLVLMSFVIAYASVYAGDGAGILTMKQSDSSMNVELIMLVAMILIFVAGIVLWLVAMIWQVKETDSQHKEIPLIATGAFACLAFIFGYFATPFASYGPLPWNWISRFLVLLVIAIVPTVFVVDVTIRDVFKAIRALVKKKKENLSHTRLV